jgi:hypothetical protein
MIQFILSLFYVMLNLRKYKNKIRINICIKKLDK